MYSIMYDEKSSVIRIDKFTFAAGKFQKDAFHCEQTLYRYRCENSQTFKFRITKKKTF